MRADHLSTIEYRTDGPPATKTLDFSDLPCPPSDVAKSYDPRFPYFPILYGAPFDSSITYDHGRSAIRCKAAGIRDPPVRAVRVDSITGPKATDDTIT